MSSTGRSCFTPPGSWRTNWDALPSTPDAKGWSAAKPTSPTNHKAKSSQHSKEVFGVKPVPKQEKARNINAMASKLKVWRQ